MADAPTLVVADDDRRPRRAGIELELADDATLAFNRLNIPVDVRSAEPQTTRRMSGSG